MDYPLWERHLVTVNGRQFVDCQILDELAGTPIHDKFRCMEAILKDMLLGTSYEGRMDEVLRRMAKRNQRTQSVIVAVRHSFICSTVNFF